MKLDSKNFFYLMIGTVILLAGLTVASIAVGNKMLTTKNDKLNELKLENEIIENKKQDIALAKANIAKYEELEKIAKQIVPQDKDQAKTVREIIRFAEKSNIRIRTISFPTSNLGQKSTAKKDDKSSSGSTAISQVKPVKGMNGVYELEIIIQNATDSSGFPELIRFLKELESNRRTSQVSSLSITPSADNPLILSFNMKIKVFIKP